MRDEPLRVGGVPMEATTHVVVDAAGRHLLERARDHRQRLGIARSSVVPQEKPDREAAWELHLALQPPMYRVEALPIVRRGGLQRCRGRERLATSPWGQHGAHPFRHLRRDLGDAIWLLVVRFLQALEECQEPDCHPAVSVTCRVVSAPAEGLAIGREPDCHRPSTPSLEEQLNRAHVNRIEIRAHFSVDLDRNVVLVQIAGDLLVVERLLLHHVTPMARGVPDRQQHRTPERTGELECLVTPRKPVEGVVGVLSKVGARLEEQAVDVFRRFVGSQVLCARYVVGRTGGPCGCKAIFQRPVNRGRSRRIVEGPHWRGALPEATSHELERKRKT